MVSNYSYHFFLFSCFIDSTLGFPRTLNQAKYLTAEQDVTAVISLDVPDEEIVQRIQGRLTHLASGRVYNTDFNPPKVAVSFLF